MRISDWSSDVCSSDLNNEATHQAVLNVEVKAVADGATFTPQPEPLSFAEDYESDPANHGADSGETGLVLRIDSLGAQLIDKDGSEGLTEGKSHLEDADAGAAFTATHGGSLCTNPLGRLHPRAREGGIGATVR